MRKILQELKISQRLECFDNVGWTASSVTGVRSDINCEYSSLRVNVTVVARKG